MAKAWSYNCSETQILGENWASGGHVYYGQVTGTNFSSFLWQSHTTESIWIKWSEVFSRRGPRPRADGICRHAKQLGVLHCIKHLDSTKLGSRGLATSLCFLSYFLRYKIDIAKKSSNKGQAAVQKSNAAPWMLLFNCKQQETNGWWLSPNLHLPHLSFFLKAFTKWKKDFRCLALTLFFCNVKKVRCAWTTDASTSITCFHKIQVLSPKFLSAMQDMPVSPSGMQQTEIKRSMQRLAQSLRCRDHQGSETTFSQQSARKRGLWNRSKTKL